MARSLLAFLFCASFGWAHAQDTPVPDTELMRLNAARNTAQLERTVPLSEEQRQGVNDLYMGRERLLVALDHRYANMRPEDKAIDMKAISVSMAQQFDQDLAKVLSQDQMEKWLAAKKAKP